MTYAVLVQVKIDPASDIKHRHSILEEFVIPEAKRLAGFQKAMWLNDGAGVGTCIAQFDTRQHATAACDVLAPRQWSRDHQHRHRQGRDRGIASRCCRVTGSS